MKKILTLKDLETMEEGIFAKGTGLIIHPWFNQATKVSDGGTLEEDGIHTKVRWVAVRGYIADWCIYHSMDANFTDADYFNSPEHLKTSWGSISRLGAKLYTEQTIRELVPCDEEAFAAYRF